MKYLLLATGAVAALALPWLVYPPVAVDIAVWALFAIAVDLLLGFTGLLSFGHAAFWGTAAYTTGIVALHTGVPFPLAVLAGALAGTRVPGRAVQAAGVRTLGDARRPGRRPARRRPRPGLPAGRALDHLGQGRADRRPGRHRHAVGCCAGCSPGRSAGGRSGHGRLRRYRDRHRRRLRRRRAPVPARHVGHGHTLAVQVAHRPVLAARQADRRSAGAAGRAAGKQARPGQEGRVMGTDVDLGGRTALVTGGASGIGRACA